MTRRRALAVAPLLALAVAMTSAAPAAAQGGTNGGSGVVCSQSSPPSVVATYSTPQRVSGGGAVDCAPVGAVSPSQFGPTGTLPHTQPPAPGTTCDLLFETPIQARLNGSTAEYNTLFPSPSLVTIGQQLTVDPAAPPFHPSGFGSWSGDFVPANISEGIYVESGTWDLYRPWEFIGKWNAQGQCVGAQGVGNQGWRCGSSQHVCIDPMLPPQPAVGTPLPVSALPFDLGAFVHGQFFGGTITSLPNAQPNPGLVNIPTCFGINGITVTGGGDPLLDEWWQQIVQGPPLDEGRHVFYSFLIHVHYFQTVWDFGDGTAAGPASPGSVPQACASAMGVAQVLVTHTYQRYDTAGFHVHVTHLYQVDASEVWVDSRGAHGPQPVGQLTVPVPAQPADYVMPVVQEEGVPIG